LFETPPENHTARKDNSNDLFTVQQISAKIPKGKLSIMGETVHFIIDTGACTNIIDIETYNKLQQTGQITLESVDQHGLFAYGSVKELDILDKFFVDVSCNSKHAKAEFYVFNGVAKCLLSFKTVNSLSLISCSDNVVCSVLPETPDRIMNNFPEVFQGLGKLRGYTVKFHIYDIIQPVAQPVRRLPIGLRDKVRAKLDSLVENGVSLEWVSPLCVLKDNGDISQMVDMRRANKAIIRERHHLPTTKEMLAILEGSKIFSKPEW